MARQRRIPTGLVLVAAPPLVAGPVRAQGAAPGRLNWFWSVFAGFVLAGLAIALFAWLFGTMRMHWSIVLWVVVTLILRYGATV